MRTINLNLQGMFDLQASLDAGIKKKHPENYDSPDYMMNKFYALKNEINEAWNDSQSFKMWSTKYKQPKESFLEEMIDVLHFWLSSCLDMELNRITFNGMPMFRIFEGGDLDNNYLFMRMDKRVNQLIEDDLSNDLESVITDIMNCFLSVIYLNGFSWTDVVQAYSEKNRENIERQMNGY